MQWKLHEFLKREGDTGNGGSGGGASGGSGDGGAGTGQTGEGTGDGGTGDAGTGDAGGESGAAGGDAGSQDWRTQYITDERLRGAPALKDIPDIPTLIKNHVELQSHLGNSIRIPSEEAGPEAIAEFNKRLLEKVPDLMYKPNTDDPDGMAEVYNQLGRPATADAYVIPEVGEGVDHSTTEAFKGIAHKFGLSQKQFEGIVKEVTQANIEGSRKSQAQHDAELKALRDNEWGVAFDDNLKLALNIAEQTAAPPELVQAIRENKATPATLKWLHSLGKNLSGEGLNFGSDDSTGNNAGRLTPLEARERISEMLNNKQHPYWNVRDQGHQAAIKRMLELQKMANPNASTDVNDLRSGVGSRRQ